MRIPAFHMTVPAAVQDYRCMPRNCPLVALALLFGAALACAGARGEERMKSFLGERPPELIFESEWWINTEPLTLEKLRGKVVWLQYHF